MNLKKSFAMALVSVAFALAQEVAPAAPASTEAPAQPAQQSAPVVAPQPQPAPQPAPIAEPQPAPVAQSAPTEQPAPAAQPAPAEQPVPPPAPVAVAPAQGPEAAPAEAPAPDGAVRMGPPKTPFTVLHGNAYNRVLNEAAGDNVNMLLDRRLTKMALNKFFYVEPSGEMGAFSLGGFFGAMDISGEVGRATAGYATPSFAVEVRAGLGQFKSETENADVKTTYAGDDWGLILSKTFGGYVVTLGGEWRTFKQETNVDPKRGPKTEERYRDLDASLIVTDGPSARKHFWSAGVAFNRHEDELERAKHLIGDSLSSSMTFIPVFNYGTPALRSHYANVYLGLNTNVPVTIYDKRDLRDTVTDKKVKSSLYTVGVNLQPNILGEVALTESLMLFGEASYTWEAFRYVKYEGANGDYKVKRSVSDKAEASMGFRYQYKDWAACEFAFGDEFFTDTKSIFNGENVFISFGGFIYF